MAGVRHKTPEEVLNVTHVPGRGGGLEAMPLPGPTEATKGGNAEEAAKKLRGKHLR